MSVVSALLLSLTVSCGSDVEDVPVVTVTSIKLNQTSASLSVGQTVTLTATITPSNASNKSVTWSTSDSNVAVVSNGTVTAVSAGSATITARTANGLSATCSITVKEQIPEGSSEGTREEKWK